MVDADGFMYKVHSTLDKKSDRKSDLGLFLIIYM